MRLKERNEFDCESRSVRRNQHQVRVIESKERNQSKDGEVVWVDGGASDSGRGEQRGKRN